MGLSPAAEATWGIAGTWRKGWKIRSETRREPGHASEVCALQTLESKQFTEKLTFFFLFFSFGARTNLVDPGMFTSFLVLRGKQLYRRPPGMFWTRRHLQKQQMQSTITKGQTPLHRGAHTTGPALLFCFHFVLAYIHPLRLSALCMPVQHSRGPPGEQTHTAGYAAAQQPTPTPFPIPAHSASSVPTAALPLCPASLPCGLDADKTGGPMVPSAWCQHFPLERSQSRCVTYELGDRKQLPSRKKPAETIK